MKKLFLSAACALALLAAQSASAQYYLVSNLNAGTNPEGLNTEDEYPVGGGLATGWTTLLTGTAATLTTPVWSAQANIPFGFQFNGQPVSAFKVATSGVLTFNTAATTVPSAANTALPSAQIPDQSVCVWGLGAAAGDYIVTKTFGTAPNRQHWIQFNSYSKPGNATAFTYWSIVLEEGSNAIYVVDQRSSATTIPGVTVGVQIDATTAVQVAGTVNSRTASDPSPADNSYFAFNPGTPPARDLKVTSLNLPTVASRQNPIAVGGGLLNLGTDPVTSYTVNYKVNNGATVSGLVTSVNLATQATGTFNHPTPWQPTAGGSYNVKVWLSDPNGAVDQNPRNDTLRATVFVGDSTMQRKVVEEDFTSSTCNPCRAGNINTHTINTNAANRGKFVEIKYQQNFPAPGTDPYYTAESGARFDFYDGSYIPYMIMDGGWNENSQSYTAAILNQYYAKPAIMRVLGTYSLTGTTISARATVRPFLGFPAGRLVAHTVVVETETRNNARTNGETVFYNVMKKMLPNQDGTQLPALTSGQNYSLNQSFDVATLPTAQAVENPANLRVIVFVQDVLTKEVYQGEMLAARGGLSTRNGQAGPSFVLAPNPTTGSTRLLLNLDRPETVTVDVLDALGRLVLSRPQVALGAGAQEVSLNLTNRAAGIYTVRLTSAQGVRTSKLTVE